MIQNECLVIVSAICIAIPVNRDEEKVFQSKTSRKILDYPYHLRQVCNYNSRSLCKERSHLPIVNSKLVVFRTTSIQSGHLQLVINCDPCIIILVSTSGNDRYFAKVADDLCSSKLGLTQLRCSPFHHHGPVEV